jgi:hypothetical protein
MLEEVSAGPVKSLFLSTVKSSHLDKVPNSALSIDTGFEPVPKVKVSSANLVMSYRALTFTKYLWCAK